MDLTKILTDLQEAAPLAVGADDHVSLKKVPCQHRLAQTKFTQACPQPGDLERVFKTCKTSLVELNIASSWVTSRLPKEMGPCWHNTAGLMRAGLGELLQLKTLDLSGHDIVDADTLKSLTGLTSLTLQYCSLNPNFGVATALCSLTSLDISNNPKVYNIDSLAGLSGLSALNVAWCGLPDASKSLTCLTGLLSLTSLDVSNNPKLRNIDCLTGLTGLTELGVACCGLDDISKPLACLASLASLPSLTSLNLSNNKEISLTALTCLTGLAKLNISGCGKARF